MLNKTKMVVLAALLSGTSAFAQTPANPTADDAMKASEAFDMSCNVDQPKSTETVVYEYRSRYDKPTDPVRTKTFFIVTCGAGAYNENSILFRIDSKYEQTGEVPLLVPVALPTPVWNKQNQIMGFSAEIVNPYISYDKATKEFTTFAKGRGIGDAFNSGTYGIQEGQVVLRKYVMDNTFNGRVNPKVIYESKVKLN